MSSRRGNTLKRGSDRLESALKATLALVSVALIPLSIWVGFAVGAAQSALADEQAERSTAVTATTTGASERHSTTPAEYVTAGSFDTAPATWTWNGTVHRDDLAVAPDTAAGTSVEIWVDRDGAATAPPLSSGAVTTAAVVSGMFTWFAATSLMVCAFLVARASIDRHRDRQWERELRLFLGEASRS
ncbi:hypothetical protein G4H71_09340 [Rhodococcus triatomae]|uniref:Transmembrane protein n=1 Tax=Rhodococcus triatomae TaxID=300028 RepID=A0A1G8HU26_9NOCA|nr:hypothetical protein [Rhodococcus triatomae]QNG20879.1 hypothetical protein G4H72_21045 [Rhodococcus triatomae]QNG23206.1 hypothetical protein G4H71_09340 [Rhodococcus triatomae]SDI10177.1 hypothetical protein SAMN05444695_10568 [Rhodococcus triatomae]